MGSEAIFSRVTVLGTGLIGGSFALAVRQQFPEIEITGWDREEVLAAAAARGAVQRTSTKIGDAVRGADLVYIGLPVGVAMDLLPVIAAHAAPGALVTDACGTKTAICREAGQHFTGGARFLGGHPVAGKETSGISNADAGLFRGATYALVGREDDADPRVRKFVALVRALGAEPKWCDAETHDWALGIVSHLPQLVSVALARVVLDETDETGLPVSLAGSGLRDTMRLAGSPYGAWRDVCLTNRDNIARALDRVAQAIEHLRTSLTSRELEDEFRAANELYKILRELQ
jgi:prephenate dehydrogenase